MRAFSSNFDAIRIVENGQYEKGKKGDENVRLLLHSAKSLDGVSSTEDYSALLCIASKYIVHCSVYRVQYTVYSMQFRVCSVQCKVHSVQCTVHSLQCTVYSVESTMYSASLYNENSMLVHCIFVQCTVNSAS